MDCRWIWITERRGFRSTEKTVNVMRIITIAFENIKNVNIRKHQNNFTYFTFTILKAADKVNSETSG